MAIVRARGLVKTFGEGRVARRVLDGADLTVEPGEVVAVLGRSGTGKSTLLHLLGGLDRAEAGTIELAGESVTGASEKQLSALRRRHVGFVFQFFHLLPELTGEANVLLAGRVRGARPDAAERGRELVDRLGLRPVADSLPHQLSGGEQQRFAIARALVNDPAVLLADEPTGNLDAEAGAEVLRLLRAGAYEGRAVVMVTHEAAAAGDRRPRADAARREAQRVIALALAGLRARRSRTLLAAAGVLAASLVVGTGVTVGYGLATGFERCADQSDLPDVIARFDAERRATVDERVRALPNLAARSYRYERNNIPLTANGHHTHRGAMHVVLGGRRGYVVTEGRDLSGRLGEVVVERGLAREWDLHLGDTIDVGRRGPQRIVGIAVSPDNVAFPLATRRARLRRRERPGGDRRRRQRRAAVAQRPGEGGRHADPGAGGVVRPRAAPVRHARRRARAARPGGGDRDLAAGRVLARGARRRRDDARGRRARRRRSGA